ncbi:MAG: hypothetical protein GXO30_00225, partial [Epsilonproteobacteria bacterium]|nr:hypothetical protein [Campylobacterota bacterium]
IWRQYNEQNNYKEMLAKYCQMDILEFIEDEKVLYGVLKAKLTKKELKLFAMDSANISNDELKETLSLDDKELEKAKFKLYKKLKQDKTRLNFRAKSIQE